MAQHNNHKEEAELRFSETLVPTLCVNNCGLYDNPSTNNMCTSCFRSQIRPRFNEARPGLIRPADQPLDSDERAAEAEAERTPRPVAARKAVSRCGKCRKRVGLTGFRCRCGDLFCGVHRYSDRHGCGFDYKAVERERIQGLLRSAKTLKPLLLRLRPISTATAVSDDLVVNLLPPYSYIEGFPRPDSKHDEIILAIPRAKSGKSIAAKERKVGRVPSIVFEQENGQEGGNKRLISVQGKQIKKLLDHLGRSFFLSRLFELEVRSELGEGGEVIEKVRALPRKLHLHSGTDAVLNVTFLRAPSSALLKVDVPLVFRGDDVCPGLRKGAYLNTIKRTVKYLCPADIVPPYIDVDLSELDVGQKLLTRDLKVHPALKLLYSPDQPVCNIIGARVGDQKKPSK